MYKIDRFTCFNDPIVILYSGICTFIFNGRGLKRRHNFEEYLTNSVNYFIRGMNADSILVIEIILSTNVPNNIVF